MAEPFTMLTGPAAPYLEENVATNVISVQRPHSAGPYKHPGDELFFGLRFDGDGNEIPDFVLNRPRYRDSRFLIAGANFGCASSREAAVTALSAFGIRCVVAPSVGDIFFNNCFKFGVLPVLLPEADVLSLAEEASSGETSGEFSADLLANLLTAPSGKTYPISLPEFRRTQLLEGLDEIALTMRNAGDIAAFHSAAAAERPYLYRLERPVSDIP